MVNQSERKFLTQSYQDSWNDYITSLSNPKKMLHWDWVIISASSDFQAKAFQMQLDQRAADNFLQKNTKFAVVADVGGKRIGSGGATLNILKFIAERDGINALSKLRILVIHSGGDSKRIPQYSAKGKLFAPVPNILPNGKRSTIFDEILISLSAIPARSGAGMLAVSGDTLLLFNPVQVDLLSCDAAGLSVKAGISVGKEHGVFVADENNYVTHFLHKQTEKILRKSKAVDSSNNINLDTGFVWFNSGLIKSLFGLICKDGKFNESLFKKYVNNKVSLSFYADFIFPLTSGATIEKYLEETPENVISNELIVCRKEIWNAINDYKLEIIKLHPSKYIHFGTMREFFDLLVWQLGEYEHLNWQRQIICNMPEVSAVISNSFIEQESEIPSNCYIEDSLLKGKITMGQNTILSGITAENIDIPESVLLHCIKLKNKKFVCRIIGINDNPKNSIDGDFLSSSIREILTIIGISKKQICDEQVATIWNAKLYSEYDTAQEALSSALVLWKIAKSIATEYEINLWKTADKHSLKSSFNEADVSEILRWNNTIEHMINVDNFIRELSAGKQLNKALMRLEYSGNSVIELHELYNKAMEAQFPLNMRLYHAMSYICRTYNLKVNSMNSDDLEDLAYEAIKNTIVPLILEKHEFLFSKFVNDFEKVELPVRVNFCGSPSDAAPYCLEHGGTMLNGALLLCGKKPIIAEIKKLSEPVIIFESIDLKSKVKITNIEDIRNCGNPYDTFALHKSVLLATGVIPLKGSKDLSLILGELGGGFHLSTFADVPKGSGLGTSSIVAAACIKIINKVFAQDTSDQRIYAQVFAAEQLMNTGGGWQDQAGGLTPGLKLIKTDIGNYQHIVIEELVLKQEIFNELNERFALIFSGQRRLARNVLREELNRCIENDETALKAIERIRSICILMKFELEKGNIKRFAEYITEQFELVKTLDKGASNTYIEHIFDICDDLIDGKAICGAGGGGFLQVILKKGITKKELDERLKSVFEDCGVKLWDCELI
jgi:fucokinase